MNSIGRSLLKFRRNRDSFKRTIGASGSFGVLFGSNAPNINPEAPLSILSRYFALFFFAIRVNYRGAAKGFGRDDGSLPLHRGSTFLQSSIFDEGWQEGMQISYEDLQWQNTGERLTKETFEAYREKAASSSFT